MSLRLTRRIFSVVMVTSFFLVGVLSTGWAQEDAAEVRLPQLSPEERPELRIFRIRYASAHEAAQVIAEIYNDRPFRLAVDERTNAIILHASRSHLDEIADVISGLDTPQGHPQQVTTQSATANPRRRLIFYWLASGSEFQTDHAIPEQIQPVIEELHRLGVENTQLVSRSIAALDGQIVSFENNVEVAGRSFQLSFQGRLQDQDGDGILSELEVDVHATEVFPQSNVNFGGRGAQQAPSNRPSSLQTTITTPPDHFVVLGITGLGDLENAFVIQIQSVGTAPRE